MNPRIATSLLSVLGVALLSGCMSTKRIPDYACPLEGIGQGHCASMQEAYAASMKVAPGQSTKVQSVFDTRAHQKASPAGAGAAAMPVVGAQLSNLTGPSNAAPVYEASKVMRLWLSPYKDFDNNLRSGEFVYFATEGRWSYGDLTKAGAASSATYQPTRPTAPQAPVISTPDRPFITSTTAVNAQQQPPAAPPEAAAAANAAQQANQPSARNQSGQVTLQPSSPNGITQPYARISN